MMKSAVNLKEDKDMPCNKRLKNSINPTTLTPKYAQSLLERLPKNLENSYYSASTGKFFKHNEHGRLLAWSETLNKWFLWLHPVDPLEVHWSQQEIQNSAALSE